LTVSLKSPTDVQEELRARFRKRRLALNLTQEGVAKRSGVTVASLRRFERSGLIAFDSLLKIALVLDCLADFDRIATDDSRALTGQPLDMVLARSRGRRKGSVT
jgi:transcriptional regulator with XRE-family HTH domain